MKADQEIRKIIEIKVRDLSGETHSADIIFERMEGKVFKVLMADGTIPYAAIVMEEDGTVIDCLHGYTPVQRFDIGDIYAVLTYWFMQYIIKNHEFGGE